MNAVTVSYVGHPVGDADLSGTVDAPDASAAAQAAAAESGTNQYGDVNGDGQLTAVDAMLVAQYDAGNRTAEYGRA